MRPDEKTVRRYEDYLTHISDNLHRAYIRRVWKPDGTEKYEVILRPDKSKEEDG